MYQDASVVTGDPKTFGYAIAEIEDQLIKRRAEISKLSAGNGVNTVNRNTSLDKEDDRFKSKFCADVTNLRNKFKESGTILEQWQTIVAEKYDNLLKVINKYYPEAWLLLEFRLAVKTILNIEGFTLPFMGVDLSPSQGAKSRALASNQPDMEALTKHG